MYADGVGTTDEISYQALKWYSKAAEKHNHKESQYHLGLMYYYYGKKDLPQDYKKALHWLKKSADNNFVDAPVSIGCMYRNGLGVEKDEGLALQYYTQAANSGDIMSVHNIGELYLTGSGVKKSFDTAAHWYEKAARDGYSKSMNHLDEMYRVRNDDQQSHETALAWWKKFAELNDANGQRGVGWYYFKGLGGVEKDYDKSMEYFREAAKNGCTAAYADMEKLYHYGYGVPIDYNEALRLYEQANETGMALNGIGLLYQNGLGVAQDHNKALEYFKMSADKEWCGEAFNSLGDVHYHGYGNTDQSYEKAFKWYTRSARNHSDEGQFNLGLMYLKEKGTKVDYNLALHWMKKAAHNGNDKAHEYIVNINQMVQDSQKLEQSSSDSNINDLVKLQIAEKVAKAAEEQIAMLIAQLELKNLEIESLSSNSGQNPSPAVEEEEQDISASIEALPIQNKSAPKKFFHVEDQSSQSAVTKVIEKKKEPIKFFKV